MTQNAKGQLPTSDSSPTSEPALSSTKLALSMKDTSEITGLGPTKLWSEIRDGRLRARKVGRRTLILPEDLRAYLDSLPPK